MATSMTIIPLGFKARSSHRASRPLVVKALALPETYGYVLGSVAATALMTQFLAVKVALARRESGVKYPSMYAEGDSEAAVRFNCTQRAHQNTLEYLPNALALQMLMGLQYPITAAAMGAAWTVSRLIYAAGYSSGDPAKRAPGSTLAGIVYLALIGGCAYAGFRMLVW